MATPAPSPTPAFRWMQRAGGVLLLLWLVWWTASFLRKVPELYRPPGVSLAMPVYTYLGVDFIHNEAGVLTWRNAGSPYPHLVGDPINPHYLPPPLTLYAFSWTLAFPPDYIVTDPRHTSILSDQIPYPARAILVWFIASTGILLAAVWWALRCRRRLGLAPLPGAFIFALTLFSYPVTFELERGNFNVLVLFFIFAATLWWPRVRKALRAEAVAGFCAGIAAALKVFPLILFPGFLVLRRYVAAVAMVVTVALVWLGTAHLMTHWTYLAAYIAKTQADAIPFPMHSLSILWHFFWKGTPLGSLSGGTGALLAIAPPAVLVGGALFFSPVRDRFAYPFLLWLAALGTFAMMISVDYNLLLLLVATIALWKRGDPWWIHVALVPWWVVLQPFLLVPDVCRDAWWCCAIFLGMKVWSILAVGGLLLWRLHTAPRDAALTAARIDSPAFRS
jgi:hypothetical protein